LLHTADVWEHFVHSDEEGIHCDNPKIDYGKVLDRKNKIVAKHAKGVVDLATLHPIDAGVSVGKGAATAGKDVIFGTVKGTAKITKGVGKAIKKIF